MSLLTKYDLKSLFSQKFGKVFNDSFTYHEIVRKTPFGEFLPISYVSIICKVLKNICLPIIECSKLRVTAPEIQ